MTNIFTPKFELESGTFNLFNMDKFRLLSN